MGTNRLALKVNEMLDEFREILGIHSKLLAEGYAANAAQRYLNPICNTMMLIADFTDYAKQRQGEVGVRITQRTADKYERLCATSNSSRPARQDTDNRSHLGRIRTDGARGARR